jgi:hypothetical protein
VLDRFNPALRIVCLCLAGLVLWQISRLAFRKDDPLQAFKSFTPSAQAAAPPASTNASKSEAKKPVELAPVMRARVDRIVQSEILGVVVKPQPMALIGLAGADAFVRTPAGQTVLLREGEENGGVKLLRIGTNRVLIEHEGQQKELTLFSGFGSESLLPKPEQTNRTASPKPD